MSQDLEFNFHDVVGVEIHTRDQKARSFYLQEFHRSTGKLSSSSPKVHLHWERMNLYERIPNGFQFHVHKLVARWAYQISFEGEKIKIHAVGNELAIPMVHHMLLHPAMRYLISFQDVLMLHGSSVVKDGRSVILTGKGGAGKTTTSSLILQYGGTDWQLHADDYVFIAPPLHTKGFLTRSHLYLDILDWIPDLRDALTPWERVRLELLGRLRTITRDGIKWPVRLTEARLWPNHSWAESAELGIVLLLRRSDVDELRINPVTVDESLIAELLQMNFDEANHFCRLIDKAEGTGLSEDWLEEWKNRERELIREYLLSAPIFRMELPKTQDMKRDGGALQKEIEHLMNSAGTS